MSDYRRVWVEAIKANQGMLVDLAAGKREFERLFATHPDDGMLFLERGVAFELLGLVDEATADYEAAQVHLTSPHWKQVARLAQQRTHTTREREVGRRFPSSGNQQWDAFRHVHGFARLPHDIRKRALPAVARISAEPESAGVDLRWCLEVIVVEIERRFDPVRPRKELFHRIEDLKLEGHIPGIVADQMQSVREFGKQGAHPHESTRPRSWATGLSAFVAVLRFAEENVWPLASRSNAT